VHCSLNLNTETGRLSARKPNLQNQPALEKDRYKVGVRGQCWRCLERMYACHSKAHRTLRSHFRACTLQCLTACLNSELHLIMQVRKAFCAAPGNTLVVADYGQLELRILAHIADCA
jgi:DNA polymerase-1